jgi:hypothetical protein
MIVKQNVQEHVCRAGHIIFVVVGVGRTWDKRVIQKM